MQADREELAPQVAWVMDFRMKKSELEQKLLVIERLEAARMGPVSGGGRYMPPASGRGPPGMAPNILSTTYQKDSLMIDRSLHPLRRRIRCHRDHGLYRILEDHHHLLVHHRDREQQGATAIASVGDRALIRVLRDESRHHRDYESRSAADPSGAWWDAKGQQ